MQIVAYLDVASKHLAIKSSLVAYLFVVYHNNNFKDQIFLRRCRKWFFDDFSQSRCGKTNKKYETLSAKSLWTSFASFRLLLLFAPKNNFWNVRFLIKLQPLQLSNFKDSLSQTYWAHRPKNIFLSLSHSLSLTISHGPTPSLTLTHRVDLFLILFVVCEKGHDDVFLVSSSLPRSLIIFVFASICSSQLSSSFSSVSVSFSVSLFLAHGQSCPYILSLSFFFKLMSYSKYNTTPSYLRYRGSTLF